VRSSTTLTVWLYDSPLGAAAGEVRLKDLQERGAITVVDAVTITWIPGAEEPLVGRLRHRAVEASAKGSVLGALVGTLVLAPVAGAVAGAGIANLARSLRGSGIDEDFLAELKERLTPGTSALLVLSTDADLDVVRSFVERGRARGDVSLMHARLPEDAPESLRTLIDEARAGGPRVSPDPGEASGPSGS
jgi:uncharacterized membrane protein